MKQCLLSHTSISKSHVKTNLLPPKILTRSRQKAVEKSTVWKGLIFSFLNSSPTSPQKSFCFADRSYEWTDDYSGGIFEKSTK